MTYSEKLRDPRWQKKRLQILERDNWTCQSCRSTTKNLQVHHLIYSRLNPWDYSDECYQTLCEDCHEIRQEIADKAANAVKLALRDKPTVDMQVVAGFIMEAAMNNNEERQHVVNTLHEAFNDSESGKGVLEHGLFSDAVMDLLCCQFLDEPEIGKRAAKILKSVISKLEEKYGTA